MMSYSISYRLIHNLLVIKMSIQIPNQPKSYKQPNLLRKRKKKKKEEEKKKMKKKKKKQPALYLTK